MIPSQISTRWATKNDVIKAWLELDFGKDVNINETKITEYKSGTNHIDSYNIEYWNGKEWVVGFTHNVKNDEKSSVSGVTNGYSFGGEFKTITASKNRLNVTSASRPSIYEFELYYIPEEVDKSILEESIENIKTLESNVFTVESWETLNTAVEKGQTVVDNKDATQAEVDECVKAIEEAVKGLQYKPADYTTVENAKNKVPADLTIYTDETVKALKDALDAVDRTKNITEQNVVDEYAKAIEEAIQNLKKNDDVVVEPTNPSNPDVNKPNSDNNSSTPAKTGDTEIITVYIMLGLVGLIGIVYLKRKIIISHSNNDIKIRKF